MKETIRATRREELEEMVARLPNARGRTGSPLADVLEAHFQAEDGVFTAARELAAAFKAVQRIHALALDAAQKSQVGSAAERISWSQKFGLFESEEIDAQITLKRARVAYELATDHYNVLSDGLLNDPVYV